MRRGEFVRSNIRDYKGWKGRLQLALTAVCFCGNTNVIDLSSPQFIDVYKHIGGSDIYSDERSHQEKRIGKLYIDTKIFIPPLTLNVVAEKTLFLTN